MATNSSLDRKAVLAARSALIPARGQGWLAGFGNMFGKEMGEWFLTRRWIVQALVWLLIINGLMTFILFVVPRIDPSSNSDSGFPATPQGQLMMGISLFFGLAVQIGIIGMIILTQDEVVQEKQTGTAAWILSKPVSRQAFILTKLISTFLGGLIFIVLLPGIVAYILVLLSSGIAPPLPGYLAGLGIVLLGLAFYVALVIMLGVMFEQRGPVLGIAFGVFFGGLIIAGIVQQAAYILPVALDKIAPALVLGQPLPAMAAYELAFTAAWTVVFSLVALWQFARKEF